MMMLSQYRRLYSIYKQSFISKVNIIEDIYQIVNSAYIVEELLDVGRRKYKLDFRYFHIVYVWHNCFCKPNDYEKCKIVISVPPPQFHSTACYL